MSSQRLERNPTSSRRKAIILEVGTLGHILLTSSLFRIIVGAERGFWPAFGPTFRKRTIKRGPKGSSSIAFLKSWKLKDAVTLTLRSSSGGSTLSLYWPFGRAGPGPEDPEKSVVYPPLREEREDVNDSVFSRL